MRTSIASLRAGHGAPEVHIHAYSGSLLEPLFLIFRAPNLDHVFVSPIMLPQASRRLVSVAQSRA